MDLSKQLSKQARQYMRAGYLAAFGHAILIVLILEFSETPSTTMIAFIAVLGLMFTLSAFTQCVRTIQSEKMKQ